MQRLVRRMTRFFVKTNAEDTMSQLIDVLEKAGYGLMKGSPGQVCGVLSCSTVVPALCDPRREQPPALYGHVINAPTDTFQR